MKKALVNSPFNLVPHNGVKLLELLFNKQKKTNKASLKFPASINRDTYKVWCVTVFFRKGLIWRPPSEKGGGAWFEGESGSKGARVLH